MSTRKGRSSLMKAALWVALASAALAQAPLPFAQTIARLSEPNGYFDTDNLISNESSYLQVIPELARRSVRGGAYIGVGPDQNFSYIAATRPGIAFIIDIRRDNELMHLLFKALFKESRTRVDYLCLLVGRTPPADVDAWRSATIDKVVKYVDGAKPSDAAALHARIDRALRETGVGLSDQDLRTIRGFHDQFIASGLALKFQSTGRPPQWSYPTYGDMLVDTDPSGKQSNFLGSEDAFQFVKGLEGRDLVIPVVGDLSGPSALAGIGKLLASRNERLTAFYTSNVEFYLQRDGTFPQFIANLRKVPHAPNGVIIRSIFRFGGGSPGPAFRRPTDNSASQLQSIDELIGR